MLIPHKVLTLFTATVLSVITWLILGNAHAAAYTLNFTDHLMDDSIMRASSTMTANDIQGFLSDKGSGLASFSDVEDCGSTSGAHYSYYATYYHCGVNESAAQIIYDSSQAYGINPQVILATLQKEQSLITTPNPTSSQLTYAMGYGCADSSGCTSNSYPGFFNQVDNGTWQFRTDMELGSGNNWWGYTPSSYPCANKPPSNPWYYDTGLYGGRTVNFSDGNNTIYSTLTLANMSTATLYCYTPHVYNNPNGINGLPAYGTTGQYYTGSYNFYYYFNLWFKSYAAQPVWQSVYTDSSKTTQLGWGATLMPDQSAWVVVQFKNTGNITWTTGGGGEDVRLITYGPWGRQSAFCTPAWIQTSPGCNRPVAVSSSVAPGSIGTFEFPVTAPGYAGTYNEAFGLIIDGQSVLSGGTAVIPLTVKQLSYNAQPVWQGVYADSSKSGNPTWSATMIPGQTGWAVVQMKNTSNFTWTNNGSYNVRMITYGGWGHQSMICYGAWISTSPGCTRPAGLDQATVAPGSIGTFEFPFAAPTIPNVYNEAFGLIVDGQSVFSSGFINLQVNVQPLSYTAQSVWQGVYTDSSKTNYLGWNATVSRAPSNYWAVVVVKNTGNFTWTKNGGGNDVRLITYGPWGHQSIFCNGNSNWIATYPICTRPATFDEASVPPGSSGTFEFRVDPPSYPGTFDEAYGLVIDGRTVFYSGVTNINFTVQ